MQALLRIRNVLESAKSNLGQGASNSRKGARREKGGSRSLLRSLVSAGAIEMLGGRGSSFGDMSYVSFFLFLFFLIRQLTTYRSILASGSITSGISFVFLNTIVLGFFINTTLAVTFSSSLTHPNPNGNLSPGTSCIILYFIHTEIYTHPCSSFDEISCTCASERRPASDAFVSTSPPRLPVSQTRCYPAHQPALPNALQRPRNEYA